MKKIPDIEVVSDNEAELADFVVCCRTGTPTPFKDNLYGECSECSHQVFFRPHAPKRPPRVCMECAMQKISEIDDDDVAVITTKTQQETIAALQKSKARKGGGTNHN